MGNEKKVEFTWVDNVTPLDAVHLNPMVDGINENYQALTTKADKTEITQLSDEISRDYATKSEISSTYATKNEISRDYATKLEMNTTLTNLSEAVANRYDSTTTYNIGDIVIYGDSMYRCISDIATPEEFNSSHWVITNSDNEIKRETQWETITDTTITQSVSRYDITTGGNYKKLFIRIEMTEDTSEATETGRVQLVFGSQTVWSDGSGWIGKTKSGSSTLNGTSNPKVIIFDIDVAENCTMIRARGMWNRTTIGSMDVYTTPIYNPNGIGIGYYDWSTSGAVLNREVTTKTLTLYFTAASYPLFAGSRVIVKGVRA